jgi:hypothetical protein
VAEGALAFIRWYTRQIMRGPGVTIAGLLVDYGLVRQEMRGEILHTLTEALALIARYDPRRLRRLVDGGTRILLEPETYTCFYIPATHVMVLNTGLFTGYDVVEIATAIVHEATHARIMGLVGRPFTPRRNRPREERRCIEEEIAFVRRWQPDPEKLQVWEAYKRAQLERPWWTLRVIVARTFRHRAP